MLSPQARQVLFRTSWVQGLADGDFAAIEALFDETRVSQGTVIFREGERGEVSYLLVSGAIDLFSGERRVGRLGAGQPLGLAAHLGDAYRVTATAALDCQLLVLREPGWRRLAEVAPDLWRDTSRVFARSLDVVLGRERGSDHLTVGVAGDGPWPQQQAVVLGLAGALERELGTPVPIITLGLRSHPPPPARANGRDRVVLGDPQDPAALRARAMAAVSETIERMPCVVVQLDAAIQHVHMGAEVDVLVQRVESGRSPATDRRGKRVIWLHDRLDGPPAPLAGGHRVVLAPDEPARTRALERLARNVCGRSVGLALGSGAAWGLAHIGVLEVLEESGIPVDMIAGASMGAIVGGHYALGVPPAELREIATRVRSLRDVVGIVPELLYLAADFNVTRPGLFAGDHFKRLLASIAPIAGKTFADLVIPFRAVATDIDTGARVEIGDGEIAAAIQASFSAPGILSPQRIGDHVLIDGGMVDPVPSDTVRAMGADLVIAVNVVPPLNPAVRNPLDRVLSLFDRVNPFNGTGAGSRLPNAFDVLVRTMQVMQYQLGNDRADQADVLINPALSEFWVLEFWAAAAMIARGAAATREALPVIREKLAEARGRPGGAVVGPVVAPLEERRA
jgi:NTE family protein